MNLKKKQPSQVDIVIEKSKEIVKNIQREIKQIEHERAEKRKNAPRQVSVVEQFIKDHSKELTPAEKATLTKAKKKAQAEDKKRIAAEKKRQEAFLKERDRQRAIMKAAREQIESGE